MTSDSELVFLGGLVEAAHGRRESELPRKGAIEATVPRVLEGTAGFRVVGPAKPGGFCGDTGRDGATKQAPTSILMAGYSGNCWWGVRSTIPDGAVNNDSTTSEK